MLNCREATRLLSESQDRTLTLHERLTLKLHLLMCTGCRNFDKQMGSIRQITRLYVQGKQPPEDDSHS
jgi:predicted anti-sigma-YlaC factor YlaD